MNDTKYEPGEVRPLGGKYYGTRVDIGHTTVTVWDHTGNSRPSDRELEDYGIADWDAATREQRFDITCDSHYETQEDYDLARLLAAAPRLAAALKTCADELSYYVEAEYPPERRKYPSQQAKYEGDMQAVIDARAALREAGIEP